MEQETTAADEPARSADGPSHLSVCPQAPVKSVSFHSAASLPADRRIVNAVDCLRYMISGTSLVKIKDSSRQYHRFFTLDEDLSGIRWMPSSKKSDKAKLPISGIHEIRTGKALRISGNFDEDCSFSIIHGDNFVSLDLVASSPEEANIWITGLSVLLAASKSDSLGESQRIRERWLKEVFEQAATSQKGELNIRETISLLKRLNSQVNTLRFRQRIMECEFDKAADERGKIDSTDFVNIFKETSTRPEIYFLLVRYCGRDYMTVEDLLFFLEGEQGMKGATLKYCQELVQKYEPSEEGRLNKQLLIDGFTQFLLDEGPMQRDHLRVCQDMTRPFSHYYISTSHNTYLLADQLKGPSGVEGYSRALRLGCRYLKLDCWDGPTEPVVYHGNTLTSKVPLTSVLQVIKKDAFTTSKYPLLIHLENHCSLVQQKQLVSCLCNTFEDALYLRPLHSSRISPQDMIGKIIVTGKRLPQSNGESGGVSDEDDTVECLNSKDTLRKIEISRTLSEIVSVPRTRFTDFHKVQKKDTPCDICSYSEAQALKLCRSYPEDLTNHNKHFLSHIYPNNTRVDSSNFNPIDFWSYGCQFVAMNFQTSGQMMDIYLGWFQQNGRSGYVLKPDGMCNPLTLSQMQDHDPLAIQIKIISGQQLPRPKGASRKATAIDPYVVVQMFGVPADCAEARTKSVPSDGHCTMFNESFCFDVSVPEMAVLRIVVLDDDYIGDEFIGQYSIPLEALQTGYCHITLHSNTGDALQNSTLFLHLAIFNKGCEQRPKNKRTNRSFAEIQVVGLKEVDNLFKGCLLALVEGQQLRHSVDHLLMELCEECGLADGSNIVQCVRVLTVRAANSAGVTGCHIVLNNEIPEIVIGGELTTHLRKIIALFEKVIAELRYVKENAEETVKKLKSCLSGASLHWQDITAMCTTAGIKGKKAEKAAENFLWNINITKYVLDSLVETRSECLTMLKQLENLTPAVAKLFDKERNSKSTMENKSFTPDTIVTTNSSPEKKFPHSSTFLSDNQPRGILKKHSPLPTADDEKKVFEFAETSNLDQQKPPPT